MSSSSSLQKSFEEIRSFQKIPRANSAAKKRQNVKMKNSRTLTETYLIEEVQAIETIKARKELFDACLKKRKQNRANLENE